MLPVSSLETPQTQSFSLQVPLSLWVTVFLDAAMRCRVVGETDATES